MLCAPSGTPLVGRFPPPWTLSLVKSLPTSPRRLLCVGPRVLEVCSHGKETQLSGSTHARAAELVRSPAGRGGPASQGRWSLSVRLFCQPCDLEPRVPGCGCSSVPAAVGLGSDTERHRERDFLTSLWDRRGGSNLSLYSFLVAESNSGPRPSSGGAPEIRMVLGGQAGPGARTLCSQSYAVRPRCFWGQIPRRGVPGPPCIYFQASASCVQVAPQHTQSHTHAPLKESLALVPFVTK